MPIAEAASTPGRSPTVQVVVVAYNSGRHLQRCIDALQAQSFADFETVVWDNASSDDAVERLTAGPGVQIARHGENLGFAAGNNRAAEMSASRYIAFLNPDAFPEPDWLQWLVAAAEAHGAEAVASLQLDDADPQKLDGAGDCMSIAGVAWRGGYGKARTTAPDQPCEVFSACAAAALYRRDVFEALGGFDERFFCYYEDVDLGFRLRLTGGRCLLEPRAVVRHVGGASTGEGSSFAEHYGARNRVWTFMRNMPFWLMPIALPAHLAMTMLELVVSVTPETRKIRLGAYRAALHGLGPFLAERRRWRSGSTIALARALSWKPFSLLKGRIVARGVG